MIETRANAAVLWRRGTLHPQYEDRFRLINRAIAGMVGVEIYCVADGVGSAPMGASAAQFLCDELAKLAPLRPRSVEAGLKALLEWASIASSSIFGWGCMEGSTRPIGACAATVVWSPAPEVGALIAHAGDTRLALIRDGVTTVLTPLDQGPDGELGSYFGRPGLRPHVFRCEIETGDRLLLVSDGVTKTLTLSKCADVVERAPTRSQSLALLERALLAHDNGDDMTALLVDVGDE